MIFTEFRFLFFFAAAFGIHWSLRSGRARKAWLLLCSYAFYAAWDWRFLSLILFSTLVDYVVGIRLGATDDPRARLRWLRLSLVCNLGLLGVFKYFNFFVDSGADLARLLGLDVPEVVFEIGLPVGISFYTFQTLSYSIDVHRRRIEPTRDLLDLALFVGFFPQLVAGPIVRAADFLPQLRCPRAFGEVDVRACLVLFLAGFFKKAVVSDGVAPFVDAYFADPAAWDVASAYTGVVLYAVQIYCDFSGYSDMAIAAAGLLGYELCLNFDFPYFARDITDFWRRWHVSLSTWLRDYLYIPLGGNRHGSLKTHRNLMLTMLLGGLWHGAAWRFVVWGGLHGLALVAMRRMPWRGRLPALLGVALTFWWVGLTWIFFRATTMEAATEATRAYVLLDSPGEAVLADRMPLVVACLAVVHLVVWRRWLDRWWERLPDWSFALAYGAASAVLLAFVRHEADPFIYFQF